MAATSLIEIICSSLEILWNGWPKKMEAVTLPNPKEEFALRGTCPHCTRDAVFSKVTSSHVEDLPGDSNSKRCCAAMQCAGCQGYILGIVRRGPAIQTAPRVQNQPVKYPFTYEAHYPLGRPDDSVASEIPSDVAQGFQEALRCQWVKALGATVLMCRRSVQVSCDLENALGNDLFKQIDDLASKQRITETLKNMAHRIRLLGKKGAHGDYSDIDATITDKDANDALTFMRHYLDHVYVLPARLAEPQSP
jgi:hypothetical protein